MLGLTGQAPLLLICICAIAGVAKFQTKAWGSIVEYTTWRDHYQDYRRENEMWIRGLVKPMVDELIELIGIGLCYLGIHKMESWTYRQSGSCIQDGVCQRCGAKCDRLPHQWEGDTCTRCAERVRPPYDY